MSDQTAGVGVNFGVGNEDFDVFAACKDVVKTAFCETFWELRSARLQRLLENLLKNQSLGL